MELDTSWDALSKPGEATDYFNLPSPKPLQIGTNNFNIFNAWWLAEIARLSYHPDYYKKQDISFGCFKYEKIAFIDNIKTSTHVSLLKVEAIDDNKENKACLVIAFRGTDEINDWNTNIHAHQRSFGNTGKVHSGFKKVYLSIKDELLKYLKDNSLPIFVTGHSLGAALAILCTSDIYKSNLFDSCYTFGSPRTGNTTFVNLIKCKNIYRVINNCDVVTAVPIDFAGIKYKHIGSSYLINDKGELIEGMNEDEIYSYQKDKAYGLKEYAKSKLFSSIDSIKTDLPFFLADHAPVNYVIALKNLIDG